MSAHILSTVRRLRSFRSSLPLRVDLKREKKALHQHLLELGYGLAGQGAFGATFLKGTMATKVVLTKESQAYLSFARYCRAHHPGNRLLPRVHAIHEVGRYTLVWMERLHEDRDLSTQMGRPLRRASRNHEHVRETGRLIGRSPASVASVMEKLHEIMAAHRHAFWDIRAENILFRRERGEMKVVLNDPIAF